jgi:GntR family transcriptional repressor for pyruvate dehydrogenase complex
MRSAPPKTEASTGTRDKNFVMVERRKVTTQAIDQIRRLITSHTFAPGQKLPSERELAELLGVSRPSLREVILALSALGVLETQHGRGTFVSSLSADVLALPLALILEVNQDALHNLFEVRLMLEAGAAESAARQISETALDDLIEIRARARRALDDIEAFVDCDIAFHHAIHEASGNRLLLALMDSLTALGRQSRLITARTRGVRESTLKEHQAIIVALKRRDAASAGVAMRQHLAHVARVLEAGGWAAEAIASEAGS